MIAFSNARGGRIFVGVADDGSISGLTVDDVRRLNQLISNVASFNIHSAINPTAQNIATDKSVVMIITVPDGDVKLYQDKDGVFWVKSGADKRKSTVRNEIKRMFVEDSTLHPDERSVSGTSIDDFDLEYFKFFFKETYKKSLDE